MVRALVRPLGRNIRNTSDVYKSRFAMSIIQSFISKHLLSIVIFAAFCS